MEGVLCRRIEKLDGKVVYTTRGKSCVYRASRVGEFFCKKVSSREDCAETPTDLPDTSSTLQSAPNTKFFRNGQLVIVRDGVEYNVMGQKI